MKEFPEKIAIIGVGLIGGSIAMGLTRHFGSKITILGTCNNPRRAKMAVASGIIDIGLAAIQNIPKDVKLIILATPIRTSLKILKILSEMNLNNCLIIDVGSTKKVIVEEAQKILPRQLPFIGTHPMAGSEMSGFENASADLFRNKPWIICLPKRINDNLLKTVTGLITILGGKPIFMDAKKHDELAGLVSHMFLAAASILVSTVAKQKNAKELFQMASTGFRDTTRLASDNVKMKTDIFLTNKANVLKSLSALQKELGNFINILSGENEKELSRYLMTAKSQRDNWLTRYFS